MSLSDTILLALFMLCLAIFSWGMRSFFVRPDRLTLGMKVTTFAGAGSALLHCWAILSAGAIPMPLCCLGCAVYAAAVSLFWWSVSANRRRPLRACFSDSQPPHLTQSGPYRLVRHPFYCSYLLAWLAGALATRRPWLLPTVLLMGAIYVIAAVREEEQFTRGPLADEYREYRRGTGRFLPKPRRQGPQPFPAGAPFAHR